MPAMMIDIPPQISHDPSAVPSPGNTAISHNPALSDPLLHELFTARLDAVGGDDDTDTEDWFACDREWVEAAFGLLARSRRGGVVYTASELVVVGRMALPVVQDGGDVTAVPASARATVIDKTKHSHSHHHPHEYNPFQRYSLQNWGAPTQALARAADDDGGCVDEPEEEEEVHPPPRDSGTSGHREKDGAQTHPPRSASTSAPIRGYHKMLPKTPSMRALAKGLLDMARHPIKTGEQQRPPAPVPPPLQTQRSQSWFNLFGRNLASAS
ncbi:uncharacterized protein EV422DRAFT_518774 [Fimicolochytrium jonesii]|uniref:uncharacterized protein n=1 Tax=Fimicolochytrium jonesii TaxID=1396493 RepID=UPI0022FE483E|nr:uncharacterized protein EV422DRAFT_518774 [Fimicolochytrium jonesii]KAI8824063.1 hypothetical protein EV422DRAFT_518774 [Fimicolochytrium jonesii]